jgi:hypothetical protein
MQVLMHRGGRAGPGFNKPFSFVRPPAYAGGFFYPVSILLPKGLAKGFIIRIIKQKPSRFYPYTSGKNIKHLKVELD